MTKLPADDLLLSYIERLDDAVEFRRMICARLRELVELLEAREKADQETIRSQLLSTPGASQRLQDDVGVDLK